MIAACIIESGHKLVSPWVLDDLEISASKEINIFRRDVSAVQTCDLIVADVASPSTGVGMEVMTAYLSGKKIVLVANRGAVITRMLTDMDGAVWVEYEDDDSLDVRLQTVLRQI